jgi:hypothetical protein
MWQPKVFLRERVLNKLSNPTAFFGDDLMGSLPCYGLQALIGQQRRRTSAAIGPLSADLTFKYSFRVLWTAGLIGTVRGSYWVFLFEGYQGFNLAGGVRDRSLSVFLKHTVLNVTLLLAQCIAMEKVSPRHK